MGRLRHLYCQSASGRRLIVLGGDFLGELLFAICPSSRFLLRYLSPLQIISVTVTPDDDVDFDNVASQARGYLGRLFKDTANRRRDTLLALHGKPDSDPDYVSDVIRLMDPGVPGRNDITKA